MGFTDGFGFQAVGFLEGVVNGYSYGGVGRGSFGFTILRFVSGVSGAPSTFSAAFAVADADRVEGRSEPDISTYVGGRSCGVWGDATAPTLHASGRARGLLIKPVTHEAPACCDLTQGWRGWMRRAIYPSPPGRAIPKKPSEVRRGNSEAVQLGLEEALRPGRGVCDPESAPSIITNSVALLRPG